MSKETDMLERLREVAEEEGADFSVVKQLIELADQIPDISVYGTKALMQREIEKIVSESVGEDLPT